MPSEITAQTIKITANPWPDHRDAVNSRVHDAMAHGATEIHIATRWDTMAGFETVINWAC